MIAVSDRVDGVSIRSERRSAASDGAPKQRPHKKRTTGHEHLVRELEPDPKERALKTQNAIWKAGKLADDYLGPSKFTIGRRPVS